MEEKRLVGNLVTVNTYLNNKKMLLGWLLMFMISLGRRQKPIELHDRVALCNV